MSKHYSDARVAREIHQAMQCKEREVALMRRLDRAIKRGDTHFRDAYMAMPIEVFRGELDITTGAFELEACILFGWEDAAKAVIEKLEASPFKKPYMREDWACETFPVCPNPAMFPLLIDRVFGEKGLHYAILNLGSPHTLRPFAWPNKKNVWDDAWVLQRGLDLMAYVKDGAAFRAVVEEYFGKRVSDYTTAMLVELERLEMQATLPDVTAKLRRASRL